jgi:hypothetical protein
VIIVVRGDTKMTAGTAIRAAWDRTCVRVAGGVQDWSSRPPLKCITKVIDGTYGTPTEGR